MTTSQHVPADLAPLRAESGALPPDGSTTVAGIRLPAGQAMSLPGIGPAAIWVASEELEQPLETVTALQVAFPETGLWPMLTVGRFGRYPWTEGREDDWGEPDGLPVPADAGALLFERVRANYLDEGDDGVWKKRMLPWPGLMTPSEVGTEREVDPLGGEWSSSEDGELLVLVPAPRPADVFLVLGPGAYNGRPGHAELTAVLRSWEDRYGALPLRFADDTIALGVRRPPRSFEESRAAVIEFMALSHDAVYVDQWETAVEETRGLLHWYFWWD